MSNGKMEVVTSVQNIKSVSYEPIHHKYRPKSFAQLVGQEAIATTLTNAIRSAKIAHAYLFTGPRGTGKTSSARILAKSINCLQTNQPTPDPCGVCHSCIGITKGYTIDVIEIDAASNTGVDNIRELIEKAQFAPVQCRYKVYVIDECHMLSTAAFNALLKTLEEPPKHVVFILATTDPQRVLPTIISRCQRFDFRRIQLSAMVKHLQTIALEENIDISLEAINLVAQLAQGGLRDAESLLDQLALFPEKVTPEQVLDLVGAVSEQDLLGLLQAIAADNPEVVIDFTRKILDRGREPLTILQNFAAFYRDLLIAKTAPSRQDLIACTQPTWTALVNFAQRWDKNVILRGQQQLKTAEVQIKNTTQPRLWLEITLLGLLPSANLSIPALTTSLSKTNSQQPTVNNQQPTTNSQQPTANNQQPTTNSQQPEKIAEKEEKVIVTEAGVSDLTHTWLAVVNNLLQPASQSLFKVHGQLLSVKDGTATVSMPPKLILRYITKPKLIEVETAFEKVLHQKVNVTFISNQTQSVPENQTPENQTQKLLSENSPGVEQPVTTNYQQPSSSPAITPSHIEINTASTSNLTSPVKENPSAVNLTQQPGISPSSLSKPSSSVFDAEQDSDVTQAAKKLVDFFNGKIINLTDENLELSDVIPTSENLEVYEYNDD